jgi:hypothetical protein
MGVYDKNTKLRMSDVRDSLIEYHTIIQYISTCTYIRLHTQQKIRPYDFILPLLYFIPAYPLLSQAYANCAIHFIVQSS